MEVIVCDDAINFAHTTGVGSDWTFYRCCVGSEQ